jgi:hypothetical protein
MNYDLYAIVSMTYEKLLQLYPKGMGIERQRNLCHLLVNICHTYKIDTQQPPEVKKAIRGNVNIGKKIRRTRKEELGYKGELFVLKFEKRKLTNLGMPDLAERIIHVSVERGDHSGYDILSFDESGEEMFIEVKTTPKSEESPFFISALEIDKSKKYVDKYFLYRVFNFDDQTLEGEIEIFKGGIEKNFILTPANYKAIKRLY